MKINKQVQYAILLALYLDRAGRASIKTVALNLNLSQSFLEQVARKLKTAKVIKSIRGPGGGYELIEHAVLAEVIAAVAPMSLVKEALIYKDSPEAEKRAFYSVILRIKGHLNFEFSRTIKEINKQLVDSELVKMERFNEIVATN